MRTTITILAFFFWSQLAHAHLTSDVDVGLGYTSITMKTGGNSINLNSVTTADFSYNLNHLAWNTSFNIVVTEVISSSQGPLAWTRVGLGFKYYPTGFNANRVVFDNKVEGYYWRPAPFAGLSVGFSNFSVSSINDTSGYFNAVGMDLSLRGGAEVVITTNLFLTGTLSMLLGMPASSSRTTYDFSYQGLSVLMGLKVIAF